MKPEMMNLFAVPVCKSSMQREFTTAELEYFKDELRDPVRAIANYSSRNKNVLDAQPLEGLRELLQQHLDLYFAEVFSTANAVSLKITQFWLTLSRKGESHHSHTHPNSVVSGVVYINVARQDGINFFRNEDNIWYQLVPREQNYYNAFRVFVPTGVGDIVLFPSNINHGVKQVEEDIERISLSFNTFFSGELGNPEFANALRITTA